VGILEIGSNLFGEQLQTRALVRNVLFPRLLILAASAVSEAAPCRVPVALRQAHSPKSADSGICRPLAFLLFFSASFSAACIRSFQRLYSLLGLTALPRPWALRCRCRPRCVHRAGGRVGGVAGGQAGARRVMLWGLAVNFLAPCRLRPRRFENYACFWPDIFSGCAWARGRGAKRHCRDGAGRDRKNTLFSASTWPFVGVMLGTPRALCRAGGYAVTFSASASCRVCLFARVAGHPQGGHCSGGCRGRGCRGTSCPQFLLKSTVWFISSAFDAAVFGDYVF
jgi:hypothetical protein